MIALAEHADGCVLAVRAQPGARRNAVVGAQAGALKVAVTAPPDQGRANKALAETLAAALGLKKSQVELIAGPTSRDKKFLLRGVTADDARRVVAAIVAGLEK
jgi:uncharacterized protein (TIGR00251 family)